jgi:hypothetical protein
LLSAFLLVLCNLACTTTREVGRSEKTINNNANRQIAVSADNSTVSTNNAKKNGENNTNTEKLKINPRAGETPDAQAKSACLSAAMAGKKLIVKQTFAVDFEPYRNSCFVTFADPEFFDPPLGSEFYIYQDGKKIYEFPERFNGVTTGCWIEGVSFADLNEDSMTDIIIAGMCSAKSANYSENMVYVNTGDGFTTNTDANYKLEKFKKVKDIEDFVRKNQNIFF